MKSIFQTRFVSQYEKKVEELNQVNERFITITSKVPAFIAYVDADTLKYEFVNDAFVKSFNLPREKIVGSYVKDIIGEENFNFALKYINEVKLGRSSSYENTFLLNGERRWINVNYTPDFDSHGKVKSIIVLNYDITERRQIEEALRLKDERLQLAIRSGNIGIWDWEIDQNILVWDQSMYALYGLKKENFSSAYEAWKATVHPEDCEHVENEVQAALRGEKEYAAEFRIIHSSGDIRYLKASSKTIFSPEGRALRMIGTNIDLTELKNAQEKLKTSNTHLQELSAEAQVSNNAKSEFLANMSHEIRTPLNSILGFTDYLLEATKENETKEYLNRIFKSGQTLLSLINDVLELSKMESGVHNPDIRTFSLMTMVYDTLEMIRERSLKKGLELKLEINPEMHNLLIVSDYFNSHTGVAGAASNIS